MNKLHTSFIALTATAAFLAGCPADDTAGTGTDTDSGTSAPTTTSTTGTTGTTTSTTSATTTTGTDTDPSTSGTDTESGTGSTGPEGPPAPPALGAQLDRMGRPAISTALVQRFGDNDDGTIHDDAVDDYNEDDDPTTWATTYLGTIHLSLAIFDSLDNNDGNQPLYDFQTGCEATMAADCYATLATVLANDWLVINSAGTVAASYLGAELDLVLEADPATAIGGRVPADDVIETSYSLLSGGFTLGPLTLLVDDGIDAGTQSQVTAFPYLDDPN